MDSHFISDFSFWFFKNSQTINAIVGAAALQDSLSVFNPTNFQITHAISGSRITGLNVLAKHPISGTGYVIF
jgi:hypothetical protein